MDNQPLLTEHTSTIKHGHKLIFGYLLLVLLVVIIGGVYSWQHKKVSDLNTKVTSLQSQISSLQGQVSKLNEQKTATTSQSSSQKYQVSNPYSGWKSYTLQYEKSSFKYPSTWQLSDTSSGGQDMVALNAPDGFYLNIDTVNLGHPGVDYPTTIIYSLPLTFLSQSGSINYFTGSTSSTDSVIDAELSMSSSSVFDDLFATKNISPAGVYSISLGDKTTSLTLSSIKSDPDSDNADAKLILESVSY